VGGGSLFVYLFLSRPPERGFRADGIGQIEVELGEEQPRLEIFGIFLQRAL
jgi:hypothetical protein